MRRGRLLLTLVGIPVALACLLSACSTTSNDVARSATHDLPTTSTASDRSAPPTTTTPDCPDKTASLPASPVRGASVQNIADDKKVLRIGVDQNTPGFANRDDTGGLQGFEVELAKELARRIFDDPAGDQKLQLVALPTADRLTAVQDGRVDMTISLVTVTCARKSQVLFSDVYFTAHQSLLVPNGSPIAKAEDVKGKRICATKGSTSLDRIQKYGAIPYPVETRPECLVALQQGKVDGITSDDTILAGFHAQDPDNTKLVSSVNLEDEPYAIAINLNRPDLVQYVNSVLADMRDSGTLEGLRVVHLAPLGIPEGIPDKLGNPR
jgi:polar amino acid transport system substrate-binding protein